MKSLIALVAFWSALSGAAGSKCGDLLAAQGLDRLFSEIYRHSLDDEQIYTLRFRTQQFDMARDFENLLPFFSQRQIRVSAPALSPAENSMNVKFQVNGKGRDLLLALIDLKTRASGPGLLWTVDHQGSLAPLPSPALKALLRTPLRKANLPARARRLIADGIVFVGDLVQLSAEDLLRKPNIGTGTVQAIEAALAKQGLHLGMFLLDWPDPDLDYVAVAYANATIPTVNLWRLMKWSHNHLVRMLANSLQERSPILIVHTRMRFEDDYLAFLDGNYFAKTRVRDLAQFLSVHTDVFNKPEAYSKFVSRLETWKSSALETLSSPEIEGVAADQTFAKAVKLQSAYMIPTTSEKTAVLLPLVERN